MNPRDEHDWAMQSLPAYSAALLDESDSNRFDRHAATCAECQEQLAELRDPAGSRGHLSEALINHWAERRGELRGLERELVRRHLDGCGECRAILEFLGHEPLLERIPGLEASNEVLAALKPSKPRLEPVPIHELRPRWRMAEFWTGGLIGGAIAAAAAFVFVVNPMMQRRPPTPTPGTSTTPPVAVTPAPKTEMRLALLAGGAAGVLGAEEGGSTVRGEGHEQRPLAIGPDQKSIRIGLTPEPGIPLNTPVDLELIDTAGNTIDRTRLLYSYLLSGGQGLALTSSTPLPPGVLTLRLSWMDREGATKARNYRVELRH